jgi:capsular exopolysaccharide synthesis family protein
MSAPDRLGRARESDSFQGTLDILRRRWLIMAAVVVASVAIGVVRHERAAKSYASSASVTFQSGTLSDAALQVSPSSSIEPVREAATEVLIAHSPEVASAVATQLHLSASPTELLDLVSVEAAENADVLKIEAVTSDPHYSARLANAFAQQYIAFKARSQLAGITAAQNQLQQQIVALPAGSSSRVALEQSQQRLSELRAVAGGSANIIGLATPASQPKGPSASTTVIISFLIGLAIAFSLVFLLESLDRRIRSIEEFEREYRLPALTAVPQAAFPMGRAGTRGELLEPYRILRSALDFTAVTRELDTLLVTSAVSGEGKTTTAVDLAHVVALAGRRVVLVELDLRRPSFAAHFEIDPSNGLTTALAHGTPLSELLVEPFSDLPHFSVLPAGRLPHNPSELLGSPRVAEIISELAASGALVILDAPPLNPVADAQVLLNESMVHGLILVARLFRTTRDEVRRARAILDRRMVEPVGLVVTGLQDAGRYGYGAYEPAAGARDVDLDGPEEPSSRSARPRLPIER